MSFAQNLSYSIVQVGHNLGAVLTVSGPIVAIRFNDFSIQKKIAVITLAGWGIQAVSGALFGATSFYFYHHFPDISGIALNALIIKIACTITSLILLIIYLVKSESWSTRRKFSTWIITSISSIIAMSAAAFLRWFS